MGNVNEKNTPIDEEKEVRRSLLEPAQHLDPKTDETEEQVVETTLYHSIETRQHTAPLPKWSEQSLSIGHNPVSYEPAAVQGENASLQTKNEYREETGNVSLPLSESIIPQSFEAYGTTVSPLETVIPVPLTSETHSPDSIEEITEHTALLSFGGFPSPRSSFPSPGLFDEFQTGQMGKVSEAITLCSVASDRAAAITEQVMQRSPLALASNSLYQIHDIPIIPLPPLLMAKPMEESTAVLSPLVLGLSTLANTGDMELPCLSETENRRENRSPVPTGALLKELISFEDTTTLDNSSKSVDPRVTPLAPRRRTIPLPPLSTEDVANPFVSEIPSLERSSLDLIDLTPPEQAVSVVHCSPTSIYTPRDATESNQSSINSLSSSVQNAGSDSEPLDAPDPQSEVRPSVQVSAVENEPGLLRTTISILNLDASDKDKPRSTCQATRYAALLPDSSQEAQAVNSEADIQVPSLTLLNIRTYADATNIAMKNPELAKLVLQAPLASGYPSKAIDQETQKTEDRENVKDFQSLLSRTKGSVGEDISLVSSRTAPLNDAERGCDHTASTPNWAIAPVLDTSSLSMNDKSQRGRGRRRAKKMRIGQGDGNNLEDSRFIYKPMKLLEATPSVSLKLVKEESPQFIPLPHDRLTSSEELQNIMLTNRQKVNKWISESASVIWSPKSDAARGSHAMASCSASLSSGLEQVSDGPMHMVRDDSIEKAKVRAASRVGGVLVTRENPETSLNERVLVEDDYCLKRTVGSIPIIVNALAKDLASSDEGRKVNLSKGKKNSVRSPTVSNYRPRSASTASSLASGVSMKSGVPASSRLFRRAIERIGSKDSSRPIYGVPDNATCRILPDRQHIEKREIFNPAVQLTVPLYRKSFLLDSSTPINAVTEAQQTIFRDATLGLKGKLEAVISSYHTIESSNHAKISGEHFAFTFKTPQASSSNDDQDAHTSSRGYIGPFIGPLSKTLVEATNAQIPRSQQGEKTPRPPSSKAFIPMGRYVPPPARDNEARHGQTAIFRAKVTTRNGTPNQQRKVPQLSWPRVDTEAASIVTTTHGMNVHAPRYRSSDDVSAVNHNEGPNDVMPDVELHFTTGNGHSGGTGRLFEGKSGVVGQNGQLNSGSSIATVSHNPVTVHSNHSGADVRSRGAMMPSDSLAVNRGPGIRGTQTQADMSASQRHLNEYMAKLSLAQKRIQANMDDIMKSSASGHDQAEALDSVMPTGENRKLEQADSASSGPVAMRTTRFSARQPSTSIKFQSRHETRTSGRYPTSSNLPRLQSQVSLDHSAVNKGTLSGFQIQTSSQNMDQCMFEEFCRRQREETRTVNERVPSMLPRRKV